jgi:hypothetical protein
MLLKAICTTRVQDQRCIFVNGNGGFDDNTLFQKAKKKKVANNSNWIKQFPKVDDDLELDDIEEEGNGATIDPPSEDDDYSSDGDGEDRAEETHGLLFAAKADSNV